jgi:hypothetical protein
VVSEMKKVEGVVNEWRIFQMPHRFVKFYPEIVLNQDGKKIKAFFYQLMTISV